MIPEGLLTFAFGAKRYIDMAKALSMSYRRHSPSRPIAIVTDEQNAAALAAHYDIVIPMEPAYGSGVVQKLHIDRYTPFQKTLFVDSDCLFYKHPDFVWDSYAHDPFCVRGWRHLTGNSDYEKKTPYEWLNDVGEFLKLNNIKQLPHFNSGVLYFDSSAQARLVFQEARSVYENREALGFVKFKTAPIADEPAFAVAMERVGVEMLPWDPVNGMETALGMRKAASLDILTGKSTFLKNGAERSPALIHYNVNAQFSRPYNRDKYRLFYEGNSFQPFIAELLSFREWFIKGVPKQGSTILKSRYARWTRAAAKSA